MSNLEWWATVVFMIALSVTLFAVISLAVVTVCKQIHRVCCGRRWAVETEYGLVYPQTVRCHCGECWLEDCDCEEEPVAGTADHRIKLYVDSSLPAVKTVSLPLITKVVPCPDGLPFCEVLHREERAG